MVIRPADPVLSESNDRAMRDNYTEEQWDFYAVLLNDERLRKAINYQRQFVARARQQKKPVGLWWTRYTLALERERVRRIGPSVPCSCPSIMQTEKGCTLCGRVRVPKDAPRMVGIKATYDEHDPVNHPSHYTSGDIECIDAIRAALGSSP